MVLIYARDLCYITFGYGLYARDLCYMKFGYGLNGFNIYDMVLIPKGPRCFQGQGLGP